MHLRLVLAFSSVCAAGLAAGAGAAVPLGGEFQVNSYTQGNQAFSGLAVAPNGSFVVISGNNQNSSQIYAQRFDSSGARLGVEFEVNTYTGGLPTGGRVAMDDAGNFVVAWEGFGKFGDYEYSGIGARRFSSAGVGLATEFRVNAYTSSVAIDPVIAMDSDGDFVVIWDQNQFPSAIAMGIFGRRFASSGAPIGGEFQVTDFTFFRGRPAVAMDGDGDFVVAWDTPLDFGGGGLGGNRGVMGQRFSSAGVKIGPEFLVNSYTTYAQDSASIAMSDTGGFFVVWTSNNQDGQITGVFGQRFNADATKVGGEFQVNTYTAGSQYTAFAGGPPAPQAIALNGDNIVVVWTDQGQDAPFSQGIFGQRFNTSGARVGPEFQINVFATGTQVQPWVGLADSGAFVVVWNDVAYHDGDGGGIFGRRFDGFVPGPTATPTLTASITPSPTSTPTRTATPTVTPTPTGPTPTPSNTPTATPTVTPGGKPSDITGDGSIDPLTDGLLILRYLFGFSGGTLTSGAVDPDCWRCDPAGIQAYLASLGSSLDIDGNGTVGALTDGLLLLRRMFGFSGVTLISGAVAGNCTRCDAGAIEAYIDALFQ